ncbi:MAG: hypothetical protein WCK89_22475 [bacterium]
MSDAKKCPACGHRLTKKYMRGLSPLAWQKLQTAYWLEAWNALNSEIRELKRAMTNTKEQERKGIMQSIVTVEKRTRETFLVTEEDARDIESSAIALARVAEFNGVGANVSYVVVDRAPVGGG